MKREFLLFRILAKRILRRKSVWVTLLLTVCVTAALVKLEKNSSAVIYAAVCTKDETLAAHLAEHEGLVRFVLCEDEEEVKRNVIKGEAECGYVLQEDLQKEIAAGRGNWSIEVWAGSDSAMTPVVNEILFETIFTEIATDWYAGYIAEHPAFQNTVERLGEEAAREAAKAAFLEKLTDGSTFTLVSSRQEPLSDKEESGEDYGKAQRSTYPVKAGMGVCVLLCALTGVGETLQDRRKGYFFRQRVSAAVMTVALYTGLGCAAGILTFLLAR